MVAQWRDLQLETRRVRILPLASCGHVTTRRNNYAPQFNLRYPEALDWRKWTKGGVVIL